MKVQPINTYNNKVYAVNKTQNYCAAQKPEYAQPSFKSNMSRTVAKYAFGGAGAILGAAFGVCLEPAMGFIIGVVGWLVGYHGIEAIHEYKDYRDKNKYNIDPK